MKDTPDLGTYNTKHGITGNIKLLILYMNKQLKQRAEKAYLLVLFDLFSRF